MANKQRTLGEQALMQIIAGGSAGFIEVSLMQPLDVIKTRFQIQRGPNDPTRYKGMIDCVRQMIQKEGAFSLYKGILPPILADTPKRAVKFFCFEQYKKLLMFGADKPSALTLTLAGLGSGITEGFVINPFEVVKVKLQSERSHFKQQSSSFSTAKHILKTDGFGLNGLNRGLSATLGRHGIFNMVYFGFYHNVKGIFPKQKDPRLDFASRFTIGFFAGFFACVANIPFDVAKSRIQGPQPHAGEVKYKKCFKTIATVYREEGFLALYKGLLPKVMRLGPGGAIMLIVFEVVYDKLNTIM